MRDLPHEIWLHVAQFIPALVLRDLLSLNSTFFELAMDCRYRQMSFAFLDNRMLRNLVRLKDPEVAKRVRKLHVYPAFLKQVLDQAGSSSSSMFLAHQSLRLKLCHFANHFLDQKMFHKHDKLHFEDPFRTAQDIVRIMLDVFRGLPNVTDYHIMWCGLQAVPESPVPFLSALFRTPLRKLSLDIALKNVERLFTPTSPLCDLNELVLFLRADDCVDSACQAIILSRSLAPAISRLRWTLRRLNLQTWQPLDLSPLFCTVEFLPHLEHLTIAIPIDRSHLGNPLALAQFLHRQSQTLRSLALRATQCGGAGLTVDLTSFEDWVKLAFLHDRLKGLRALDVSSSLFPFSSSFLCLRQFSRSITALVFTGRHHTHADIVNILRTFAPRPPEERLESLRLGSVVLTPQLVDLLAKELPSLYRLELLIRDIQPCVTAAPANPLYDKTRLPVETRIDDFFAEMERRSYPRWALQRLQLTLTCFPYRYQFDALLEQLFARCVPSIRGFS